MNYTKKLSSDENRCHGGHEVNPHPDGQPWVKCCGTKRDGKCVCRPYAAMDPSKVWNSNSNYKTRLDWHPYLKEGHLRFFCVHRDDNGYHRICAGWHALIGRHLNAK